MCLFQISDLEYWKTCSSSKLSQIFTKIAPTQVWLCMACRPCLTFFIPDGPWNPFCIFTRFLQPGWKPDGIIVRSLIAMAVHFYFSVFACFVVWSMVFNFWFLPFLLKCMAIQCFRTLNRSVSGSLKNFDRSELLSKCACMHREITLITHNYNRSHKAIMNGTILVNTMFGFIFCTQALISLIDKMSLFYAAIYLLWSTGNLLVLSAVTLHASVHEESLNLNDELVKQRIQLLDTSSLFRKWFNRFSISCPTLRIEIFSVSFIDRLTPLILLQLCVDKIWELLLL